MNRNNFSNPIALYFLHVSLFQTSIWIFYYIWFISAQLIIWTFYT